MEVGVITNPNSRKNKGHPGHSAVLKQIVGNIGEVHETKSKEAIKPLLREFLRREVPLWVADGGDGAFHWMVRSGLEVLQEEEFANRQLPTTLPTNGGTIDFVANNVGIRGRAPNILASLRERLERGQQISTAEVKAMLIEGIEEDASGHQTPFKTIGFAAAVGGIGQRFFSKYYQADDPCPKEIVKVVAKTVASYPVATSPLRHLPGMPEVLRTFARDMFRPHKTRLTIDGRVLPTTENTGIHVASMSINLGNVMRFFFEADKPDQMHAICGAPMPWEIIRNIPRMYLGKRILGSDIYDGPTKEMTVEAIGNELLAPIIDGEVYTGIRKMTFKIGPRLEVAKIVGKKLPN